MTKIIAEIGINHNGSLELAKDLIDLSKVAGCDYVKFQKRDPDIAVPEKKKNQSGTSCDAPMCQAVTYGATSSTREPICGLLSPKGQAHTPPGNLWPYKNAGSLCYECLCAHTRKTTTHTTQSAADGRRARGRRHRWVSSSRRE